MTGHVAVAIVGFRNRDDIFQCLGALEASTHRSFEVVICENGGAGAHAELISTLPATLAGGQAVRVISADGNLGYAGGVNVCLRATPLADAWWVLNPDTQPQPNALAALVERLAAGDCEAVGCTLYRPNGQIQSYGGRWRPWLARAESIGIGKKLEDPVDPVAIERAQNYLNGASMLVGRRFLDTVGLMREDYFLYCEELEWCLRGLSLGMRLGFSPAALVLHEQGTTTGAAGAVNRLPRAPVYLGERNKILLTRDCYPRRLPIAALGAGLALVARYGRRGAWRQLGYGVSGWLAGLAGERGAPAWMAA